MRNVVLFNPSKPEAVASPPLGLLYMASVLRKHEINPIIIDQAIDRRSLEEIAEQILNTAPIAIGITTMTATYPIVKDLCCLLKSVSSSPIILGGPHATFRYKEIFEDMDTVDVICRFHGELTMMDLVKRIADSRDYYDVPGIAFSIGGNVFTTDLRFLPDLDDLPPPARDLIPLECYPEFTRGIIFTSRGCPYECIFCCSTNFYSRKIFTHSVDRVISEVRELREKFGLNLLNFQDDFLTYNKMRVTKICQELLNRGIEIEWGCQGRINSLDKATISIMAKAGCILIYYGTESGVQRILDDVGKSVAVEEFGPVVQVTKSAGIKKVQISLMIAFPNDTHETIKSSIDFLRSIRPDNIAVQYTCPFPGTLLGEYPERYGINIVEKDLAKFDCRHPVFETQNLTLEDMRYWFLEASTANIDLNTTLEEVIQIKKDNHIIMVPAQP